MRYTISYNSEATASPSTTSKPLPPILQPPPKPSSLLHLPAEVRCRIFHFCYSGTSLLITRRDGYDDYSKLGYVDRGCAIELIRLRNSTGSLCQYKCGHGLSADQCKQRHRVARQLLSTSRTIYQEALPIFYKEVHLCFEHTQIFEAHLRRKSLAPASALLFRNSYFNLPAPNPFSIVESLSVGNFARLHSHGPHGLIQKEGCMLLEAIKYNMPQLRCLELDVQCPSMMWTGSSLRSRLWYLPMLSQLHRLRVFTFGELSVSDEIADVQRDVMIGPNRRLAAAAFLFVLQQLVTRDNGVSPEDLATWCKVGDSEYSQFQRWKVIKSLMKSFLEFRQELGVASFVDSHFY